MRVAIVHYWFLVYGGGERVVEALANMYPQADLFALFADTNTLPASLASRRLRTSFLDRGGLLKDFNRAMFPLYPLAVESLDVRNYDLVITSDSPPMKGVLTTKEQTHVCYCHTPGRFLWDYYEPFKSTLPWIVKPGFSAASEYLRRWDYAAAQKVNMFVANSKYVQQRIKRFYNRESIVVYPPVNTSQGYLAPKASDFYLHVGRLVETKRVDLMIHACNRLKRRLLVVGTGRHEEKLQAMAGPSIEFLGRVSDAILPDLYAHARALLFAADEDFGIVPLECQSYGRPVIAYAKGGALETIEGLGAAEPTGLFFQQQTVDSLVEAILTFEAYEYQFNPVKIQERARTFDSSEFIKNFSSVIATAMAGSLDRDNPADPDLNLLSRAG